ncbi:MAG: hypothetical protein AAB857_01445 [Patescibacteria group bacterium]
MIPVKTIKNTWDKESPEELKKSLDKIEKAIEEEEKERMKKYYV